mmetsp:Transcript_14775/g.39853  ORF Transcript_14775/g.39853 Transcript_14775/m.39853 type:complete len:87 (-) Transcript_14775:499-759(-)
MGGLVPIHHWRGGRPSALKKMLQESIGFQLVCVCVCARARMALPGFQTWRLCASCTEGPLDAHEQVQLTTNASAPYCSGTAGRYPL